MYLKRKAWTTAAPAGPSTTEPAGNNQKRRIISAINALTGRVDYLDAYTVGRAKVIACYQQLVQAYPDATHSSVVQDNCRLPWMHIEVQLTLQSCDVPIVSRVV